MGKRRAARVPATPRKLGSNTDTQTDTQTQGHTMIDSIVDDDYLMRDTW